MHLRTLAALCFLTATLCACEHGDALVDGGDGAGGDTDRMTLEPTLESIQTHIFDSSCAVSGCHVGSSAPLGLDLSEGNARDHLINIPSSAVPDLLRVDPGNPDDSYLLLKLENDPRISGSRMPLNLPPLSSSEIGVVRQWIGDGAE